MSKLKKLHEKIELYAEDDFNSGEYCEEFLDTAQDITLEKDPSSIPVLLKFFNEDTDYDWIFESLIGYFGNYDPKQYVTGILEFSSFLNEKSPDYTDSFFYRILNSEKHRNILREKLNSQEALKNVIPILERIMKDSKEHEDICKELLNSKTTS